MNNIDFDNLEFGDKIRVLNKLKRKSEARSSHLSRYRYKFWEEVYIVEEGIFLGKRTLNNGKRHWYSDHIEYYPGEYFDAALVAINGNTNPFYSTEVEKL